MSEVGQAGSCSRNHSWCVSEEVRVSADGSPARFHLGARTVVPAGDDAISCLLVGSEDLHSEVYLELEVESRGQCSRTVWLTPGEAVALGVGIRAGAGLIASFGSSGCPGAGSAAG